jgi:hypothetical protein
LGLRPGYSITTTNYEDLTPNKHGNLYKMMNLALQQVFPGGYEFAFFIQDDMQFLQKIDLDACCEHYFGKWPKALMISPVFLQKIYLPKIGNYIKKKKDDFIFKKYGIADVGIIHLQRARECRLFFNMEGEKFNGLKYASMGFILVLVKNPCLAWVPWAVSYVNKKRRGFLVKKNDNLIIKPLGLEMSKRLAKNKELPFLEDFTSLNTRWIPKPYYYLGFNLKDIIRSYLNYWSYLYKKDTK